MNNIKPLSYTVAAILLSVVLAGCQSAPEKKVGVDLINGKHISEIAADLAVLMEKQQQHDQLLKEWQQLKPAVSRLVVVEEELSLLINQLDQFAATSQSANREINQPAANSTVVEKPVTPTIEIQPDVPVAKVTAPLGQSDKRFAMQLTSLSDPIRLPVVWAQLEKAHPAVFRGLEPNFEKITVSNADYYRLKVGAFSNKQQAVERCTQVKALGINCLVTNYVASDFNALKVM